MKLYLRYSELNVSGCLVQAAKKLYIAYIYLMTGESYFHHRVSMSNVQSGDSKSSDRGHRLTSQISLLDNRQPTIDNRV